MAQQQDVEIPLTERLKNIPGVFGIHLNEMPKYTVLKHENDFELREYSPLLVAETTVTIHGDLEKAKEEAFMKLAGYIFGKNHDDKTMAMTSPVLQQNGEDLEDMTTPMLHQTDHSTEGQLTMSFVLPSEITAQSAPIPNDSTIHIKKVPAQTWAAVKYSGVNSPEEIAKHKAELTNWLTSMERKLDHNQIRVAQYDAPNTIPFLRRNEVQIQLWSDKI